MDVIILDSYWQLLQDFAATDVAAKALASSPSDQTLNGVIDGIRRNITTVKGSANSDDLATVLFSLSL